MDYSVIDGAVPIGTQRHSPFQYYDARQRKHRERWQKAAYEDDYYIFQSIQFT